MIELGCIFDGLIYRIFSDGYCRVGNVERVFRVKDTMENDLIFLFIEMYNFFINGFFKCGKLF